MPKPFLIIQLRPEDEAATSEFEAIVRCGGLRADEVVRARVEHTGLPEIDLDAYSGIAVRHAVRQRRTGMPSRWKTSELLGSRRAKALLHEDPARVRWFGPYCS